MHGYSVMGTRLKAYSVNDHIDSEIFHWQLETALVSVFENTIHTTSFFMFF